MNHVRQFQDHRGTGDRHGLLWAHLHVDLGVWKLVSYLLLRLVGLMLMAMVFGCGWIIISHGL